MLVFEATDQLQGVRDTDYHHAWNGELVHLPAMDCASPLCGCTRGFAGFDSHRATTTAIVVERPDMTLEQLTKALAVSLHTGGWIDTPDPANPLVAAHGVEIVELAASFGRYGPGVVVEREGQELCHRLPPGAVGMTPQELGLE